MLRALPILLLAGLGGCVYNPHEDMSPDFGEAVRSNIASQAVYPMGLRPRGPALNNGIRMDSAFQRYQTNHIYRPGPAPALQAATSNLTNGGGGGDSGSSGGGGGSSGSSGGASSGGSSGGTSPY